METKQNVCDVMTEKRAIRAKFIPLLCNARDMTLCGLMQNPQHGKDQYNLEKT